MAKRAKKASKSAEHGATVGYEAQLWEMADALRGSMDAAEYKHVVLGLIFLKYISDAFEEQHAKLLAAKASGADPEDPDEYRALSIFWVPPEARWSHLKAQARQATIGQLADDAMAGIERDNPALKGVLPKDYARPALDKQRLGQLIDLISNIQVGDEASRAKDVLGRVYEYFLSQFASAEGKKGGEFYTPRCVVKLLVEMLEPYHGRVYDPCCGSSGMFVQSVEFIRAHAKGNGNGGKARADLSLYGQESNYTTWRLAKMNLAIRGIDGQIAHGDTFHNDRHADLKADFILANPPFNISDWGGERLRDDKRWKYGTPPAGNANFAWVEHIVHHLAPAGVAGFVLANGSMSSNQSGGGEIRKSLIEADLVDCMVALPGQRAKGILEAIDMDSYRVEKKAAMKIALKDADAEIEPVPTDAHGHRPEPELDRLSNILKSFNEQFGTLFTDSDRVAQRIRDDIAPKVAADAAYQNAKENTPHTARMAHDQALAKVMQHLLKDDTQVYKQFVENESFKRFVGDMVYAITNP